MLADLYDASTNPIGRVPRVGGRGEGAAHREGRGRETRPDACWRRSSTRCGADWAKPCSRAEDEALEEAVLRLLRASERTIACAESLTGGGVGARLTRPPGASASFVGSAVVYTPEAKRDVLGVSRADDRRAWGRERGMRARDGGGRSAALRRRRRRSRSRARPVPSRTAAREPGTVWIALDADGRHPRARRSRHRGAGERRRGGPSKRASTSSAATSTGRPLPASEHLI